MAYHRHRRRHEYEAVRYARLLLVALFVLIRISDAAVYWLSFQSVIPVPALRGNVVVIAIWTTVFFVLLGLRRKWARYVLIVFTGYVAFISGIVVSMAFLVQQIQFWPAIGLLGWFVAYATTVTTLIMSRDIYRLAARM